MARSWVAGSAMGLGMTRLDPLSVATAHRLVALRAQRAWRATRPLSRGSYRLGRLVAAAFGAWQRYGEVGEPVAIHHGGDRYRDGQRRLLLVTQELSLSGAPRLLVEIAAIFARAGWLVTLVSPTDGPSRAAMKPHAAVIVDPTVLDERSPLMRRLRTATDLAICNTVLADGAVCSLASRVPTLWYLHEVSLLAGLLETEPRTARALAAAREVWAGSELSAALVRPHRQDVRVRPYGVQPLPSVSPVAVPGQMDESPIRVAVFGAIEPRKGQDLAVAALAALTIGERARVRLTLYGRVLDRSFATAVAAAARTLPVSWGGELTSVDYAAAMAATDVVLVSSRDDTLPLVSLDALGSGRVLMCTSGTGTSAWIEDGRSGFVAEADALHIACLLYTSPSPRDLSTSRMPSSA